MADSGNLFDGTSGSSKGTGTPKVTAGTNLFGAVKPSKPAATKPTAPKVTAPKSELESFFSQKNLELPTPENVNKKVAEANAGIASNPVFGPVVSVLSGVLNALQAGNAAVAGADYKRIEDNQKGIITQNDILTAALHGEKINGKKVASKIVNGQVVWNVKPTVTDQAKVVETEASRLGAAANNATAFLKPNRKTIYGADVKKLQNPNISDTDAALQGMAYDLNHDPLALVNPIKPFTALKPLVGATKEFLAATKAGDVSQKLIKDAVQNSDLLPELATKTPTVVPVKGAKGIRKDLKGRTGKAAEVQATAEKKLAEAEIKTVKLTPEELASVKSATGITNPVLATAFESAKKAYTQIAVSQQATKFLEKFAKNEVTGIRNITPTAVIHPDFSGAGGFKVLGGNGEELATATTRKGAQEAVNAIKKGVVPQGEIVPVEVAPKAPEVPVMTTKQAIELTTQDGAPLSLRKDVVHEATDGASYVFDGENVRKFATTADAQTYVQNSAKGLIKEATVLQEGKKWNVRQGDTVTPYATKAEATAAAKKINTGQITPARITTGAAPLVKSVEPSVSIADLAKIKPTDAAGKAAQKALKDVEKAVSDISGTQVGIKAVDRAAMREIVQSKNLMNRLRVLTSTAAKNAAESIRLASRLDGYNPVVLRESLMYGSSEAKAALLRLIDGTPVMTEAGEKTTLGSLLNTKKWNASQYPAGTLKNMLDALDGIYKSIMKAGKETAAGAKYSQLETAFGKDIADKVKATGILEAKPTQAAMDKYLALEKQLEAASKTVKYSSFEDVITGLASGDSIASTDLAKIINAFDPSKKMTQQVINAVDKNNVEFLKEIVSGPGVQTMNDVQKKILFTADFSNMLKVEGIGYDDELSSIFTEVADEFKGPALAANPSSMITSEFIRTAEATESPEAFARLLEREVTSSGDIATEAINTAFKKLGANLDDIKNTQGSLDTISLYGDVTSRVSKKAWVGRAALPEQINQVFDGYVASSINGIVRSRYGKAKKFLGTIEDYMIDEFINEFDKVSAALGLLGLRIQRNKIVTALTKKMGDPKHLVYLHSGDIYKAFDKTGGRQILKDAFYSGGDDFERNSFLHQNLGEGARYVLEQDAAGAQIDLAKLTELVQNGVATPAILPTKEFQNAMPKIAARMAEHLASPAVIKAMKEAHLTKSIGLASRVINRTHSVAQDIFATIYDSIRLNVFNGDVSAADMTELLRGHLAKLATAGNFFNLSSGPVAQAAFRSWSQILTLRGKVAGADLLDAKAWEDFRTAMNDFSSVEKVMPADVANVIPKHKVLSKSEMSAFLKKEKVAVEKIQQEVILGKRENVASQVLEDLTQGNFEKYGVPEEDMPDFVMQALHDRGIKEETLWGVPHLNPQLEEKIMQVKTTYAKTPGSRFKKLDSTDFYGFNGREDVKSFTEQVAVATYRAEKELVQLIMMVEDKHKNLPAESFDAAFTLLRDDVKVTDELAATLGEEVLQAAEDLKPLVKLLFGSKADNGFINSGITGAHLQSELDKVGLGATKGFKSVKGYAAEDLWTYIKDMPFGKRPETITGSGEIALWEKNAADFKASGLTPLLAFTKVAQAAGNVKFQVGIARGLYSRFSHVAEKLSKEQAIRKGYVSMVAADGQSLMLDAIPEGAKFPPNIAKQYGQIIRDYDYMRNAAPHIVVRKIMQLTGVTKALQTVINPGHHFNTFFGTSSYLVMKGVVNSKRYETGFRLAGRHFAEKKVTNWQAREKLVGDIDAMAAQTRSALNASAFDNRSFEKMEAGFGEREITIIENGKAVNYSEDFIKKIFEDAGILEEPTFQQDITNMQDNMLPDLNSVKEAELAKRLNGRKKTAKIRAFEESLTRKPGLIGAWHGNALRTTEALDIMQKRSWSSLQDAVDAAVKEVLVSQPTSRSLSPYERKWGRMATSYYTWMRMAQVQLVRMFLQNNREINIAQDLLYNLNVGFGYTPQNTGTPYPAGSTVPSWMANKAGGVIMNVGPIGPVVANPPFTYIDAGNFWGLKVDLSKPLEENIIGISNGRPVGLVWQLAAMPATNMTIAAAEIYKLTTQRNPLTGVGLNVHTPLDAYKEFLQPLLGRPGQLASAGVTFGESPDKSILAVMNYLTGARFTNPGDSGAQKVAKIEQSARINEFLKRIGQK